MKKILAALLVLTMVASFAVPAFAADINASGGSGTDTGNEGGSYDLGVNGDFKPADAPAAVISVDIVWTQMKFTYNVGSKGTWNSATHTYDNPIARGWDTSEKATITVTNHSNCEIDADFKFTPSVSGIDGVFTKSSLVIESADDDSYRQTTNEGVLSAPSATTDFSIDPTSEPLGASKALGNITISIAKIPPKMTVGTEAELKAAIAALKTTGGTITLTSDLTLTDPIEISAGTGTSTAPLIIDFGGKTIKGRVAIVGTETSRSYVTLKNGELDYGIVTNPNTPLHDDPTQAAVYARYTDLKLEELAVNSSQLALRTSDCTKTLITGSDVCGLEGNFTFQPNKNRSYALTIYNTSLDDFILANTGDGDICINGYIVSDYTITLKENASGGHYIFHDIYTGSIVSIDSGDGDKNISSQDTFELMGASQTKYGRVIFGTDVVLTE